MDSIFAKKSHQSYEMARKVESSKAYPLAKYLDRVRGEQMKTFDERHTQGGTLLEVSTNAMEAARPYKVQMQKYDMAQVLKAQMYYKQK